MKTLAALFACMAVAACDVRAGEAWSAVPVTGPDGHKGWWVIECKYHAYDCYNLAARVCPAGYSKEESVATSASETRAVATRVGNTAISSANDTSYSGRSMVIHCGRPHEPTAKPAGLPPTAAATSSTTPAVSATAPNAAPVGPESAPSIVRAFPESADTPGHL